jgi:hypothetical protein
MISETNQYLAPSVAYRSPRRVIRSENNTPRKRLAQDCLKKFDAAEAHPRDGELLCSRYARNRSCPFFVYRLGPCRRVVQEDRSVADLDPRLGRVADQRCFAIEIPSFLLAQSSCLLRTNTLAQLNRGVCPPAGLTGLSGVLRLNRRNLRGFTILYVGSKNHSQSARRVLIVFFTDKVIHDEYFPGI